MAIRKRVVVIGIDGVSFDIIAPLVDSNQLPTFTKLLGVSKWGRMQSTIPPISPLAWTSIATGKNAGDHGIFDFMSRSYQNGKLESHINTSKAIMGKTFWDIASRLGKKVIIYNYPFTFPPYRVNGLMISGFPSPLDKLSTFPSKVTKDLRQKKVEYIAEPTKAFRDYSVTEVISLINSLIEITNRQSELIRVLMDNYSWELFVCVNTVLDRAQHILRGFWKNPKSSRGQILKNELTRLIISVDSFIGSIIKNLENNISVFIVSDHGFEELHQYFGINNWLESQSLLHRRRRSVNSGIQTLLRNLMYRFPVLTRFAQLIKYYPVEIILKKLSKILPNSINYKSSLAWSDYPYGIRINEENFTDSGLVQFEQELISRILEIKDPITKKSVFESVKKREELYYGNKLFLAPHLVLTPFLGYETRQWTKDSHFETVNKQSTRIPKTGTHSGVKAQKAIFIAFNPLKINPGNVDASVFDIAPLVLYSLGLPIPRYMNKELVQRIFRT